MTLILSQNHVRLVVVSFYLLLSNTIELIDVIEVMILSSCHHLIGLNMIFYRNETTALWEKTGGQAVIDNYLFIEKFQKTKVHFD